MKDKKSVENCGTILIKSAKDDEYKWGLRFYILLIECFRQWAAFTEDSDFIQKFNRLKEKVPILEDDVYYFQALENNRLDHHKVDEMLQDFHEGTISPMNPKINVQSNPPALSDPQEITELKKYKEKYLKAVFDKVSDVPLISEEHFMYQSLFDSMRSKLKSGKYDARQKEEIVFSEGVSKLPISETIETPKGLSEFRAKVCDLLNSCHGEVPAEYIKMAGGMQRISNQVAPKMETTPELRVPPREVHADILIPELNFQRPNLKQTIASPPLKNLTVSNPGVYKSDNRPSNQTQLTNQLEASDQIKDRNQKLKEKKQALLKEVENLKNKEKQLKESSTAKSEMSYIHKIEATPDVLIEEINRKNKTFENLQNKYATLINQMNLKMHNNLEKSYINSDYSRVSHDTSSFSNSGLYDSALYRSRYSSVRNEPWDFPKNYN